MSSYLQDQFYEFLYAEAVKLDNKVLLENKSKFLLVHSSSGHKQVLKEILSDPVVASKLADTKVHSTAGHKYGKGSIFVETSLFS